MISKVVLVLGLDCMLILRSYQTEINQKDARVLRNPSNQISCPERHLARNKVQVVGSSDVLPTVGMALKKRAARGAITDATAGMDTRNQEAAEVTSHLATPSIEVEQRTEAVVCGAQSKTQVGTCLQ